jgi:hypothetical protein
MLPPKKALKHSNKRSESQRENAEEKSIAKKSIFRLFVVAPRNEGRSIREYIP